jgi:hypothetical protein
MTPNVSREASSDNVRGSAVIKRVTAAGRSTKFDPVAHKAAVEARTKSNSGRRPVAPKSMESARSFTFVMPNTSGAIETMQLATSESGGSNNSFSKWDGVQVGEGGGKYTAALPTGEWGLALGDDGLDLRVRRSGDGGDDKGLGCHLVVMSGCIDIFELTHVYLFLLLLLLQISHMANTTTSSFAGMPLSNQRMDGMHGVGVSGKASAPDPFFAPSDRDCLKTLPHRSGDTILDSRRSSPKSFIKPAQAGPRAVLSHNPTAQPGGSPLPNGGMKGMQDGGLGMLGKGAFSFQAKEVEVFAVVKSDGPPVVRLTS